MKIIHIYVYFESFINNTIQLEFKRVVVSFCSKNSFSNIIFGYDALFKFDIKDSIIIYFKDKFDVPEFIKVFQSLRPDSNHLGHDNRNQSECNREIQIC